LLGSRVKEWIVAPSMMIPAAPVGALSCNSFHPPSLLNKATIALIRWLLPVPPNTSIADHLLE
jgi:hypothetical protein